MKNIILLIISLLAVLAVQFGCESQEMQKEQERAQNRPAPESAPERGGEAK